MEINGKEYILIPKGYDPEALGLTGLTAPVQTEAEIEAVAAGYDSDNLQGQSNIWEMIQDEPNGVGVSDVSEAYAAWNAAMSNSPDFNTADDDGKTDWEFLIPKGAEILQSDIRNFRIGVLLVNAETEDDKDKVADIVFNEGIEDAYQLSDAISNMLKDWTVAVSQHQSNEAN